ncbi:MAG: hypothetical protein JWP87_683 [Labilithrix sp.]|nr:hypothetical protein [Labilithrix sp.]
MSDVASMKLSLLFVGFTALAASALAGCAPAATDDATQLGTSEAALGEAGTLTFGADFRALVSGTLQKGKKIRVTYDANRLTTCRGDQNGHPAWTITGYWKIGGGAVHSFEAGGFSPSGGSDPPVLALDASGELQIWFQNVSVWGCNAYDSDFGKNYRFTVQPAANEPGWVGNVQRVISRQTCNGPCDGDMQSAEGEILYDTWARQRAAIRGIFFEVWKDGVTNWDNPDLWKQLDVQVHSRVGSSGAFTTAYVDFDRRRGNNARYVADLGALDPIKGQWTITNVSDCPTFPLSAPAANGGQYVEATVELYFTVNGVEVRPAAGGNFRVRYQNYKSSYAVCVP